MIGRIAMVIEREGYYVVTYLGGVLYTNIWLKTFVRKQVSEKNL
jgi:hypothetical protein